MKYIFYISSFLLLVVMVLLSRNAAVSCDEVLHYQQSEAVYKYFATHGTDQSSLDTPVTHLKYYGQSYDNITTFLIHWLGIEDIYTFRHLMSSLAGWLTVFVTALFAVWLSGFRTGIFVILLFAVSPTFMGHAMNNLKDIPFALGYISAVFFSLRILTSRHRPALTDIILLIVSTGFTISIRAGGILLICYMFFFLFLSILYLYFSEGKTHMSEHAWKLLLFLFIAGAAYFLGILLWPFALADPLRNVADSLGVMQHFPDTFRQIFEGKAEWSDYMPWYYLPESMLITIPLAVLAGLVIFFLFSKKILNTGKSLLYGILIFTFLFPPVYAIAVSSNLYSSWRQFLFIYPPLVLIAASGYSLLTESLRKRYARIVLIGVLCILALHPLGYMYRNPRYHYLYYNQITGGLKGALGNYETDYYYLGQTEAAEWLLKYLRESGSEDSIKVGATYSVTWQFRKHPDISTFYMRNEDKSQYDWDYAIITNRYIPVFQLKNRTWPPENAIHVVYADSVPICAVLKRGSKDDFYGYKAFNNGETGRAIDFFTSALKQNNEDEMIFFNFAAALEKAGYIERADSVLKEALKINPVSEPVLMYLGNLAAAGKRREEASGYYEKLIGINRKYYEAYVRLAGLMDLSERKRARGLLMDCLIINPGYRPALEALADTYRESDPEIARKYDELAKKIK